MEPSTTWNSTSVSGPMPKRSRISLGIVTWPRSPSLMLFSMNRSSYLRNTRSKSPDDGDPVTGKESVFGCQRQVFGDRLCHQDPVERVFMQFRKRGQRADMIGADGKRRNSRANHIFLPPGERVGQQGAWLPFFE